MAEHAENPEPKSESLMEKIAEKLHGDDSSSSSDSDSEKKHESSGSVKAKIYRLFGRENPVHKVFGGGKRTILSLYNFLYVYAYVNFVAFSI